MTLPGKLAFKKYANLRIGHRGGVVSCSHCRSAPSESLRTDTPGSAFQYARLTDFEEPHMHKFLLALLAPIVVLSGCASYDGDRPSYDYRRYDYNRPDPSYGGYDAARYYREHPRYRERILGWNDRVYRGGDGRYYCRRRDGTTGLIIGAVVGAVFGNIIAPGDSKTLGTILGASGGAIAGREIDRRDARCR
jgi:hypothetical protein